MKSLDDTKGKQARICAVVVTFNRLSLLKKCVESLRRQTHLVDCILVVNNGSSDGTLEWLQSEPSLSVITQDNLGSAGGQYAGIKRAYEMGFDWIWCLDDDAIPDGECLRELMVHAPKSDFLAPLIHHCEVPDQLAFGIYDRIKKVPVHSVSQARRLAVSGVIDGTTSPFNGILISRKVVAKVGFPLAGLFIWGDETEYMLRCLRADFRILTCVNALVAHPPQQVVSKQRFCFGKLEVSFSNSAFKDYIAIRNYAYIWSRYRWDWLARHLLTYTLFFLFHGTYQGRNTWWALNALWDGLLGRFDLARARTISNRLSA